MAKVEKKGVHPPFVKGDCELKTVTFLDEWGG